MAGREAESAWLQFGTIHLEEKRGGGGEFGSLEGLLRPLDRKCLCFDLRIRGIWHAQSASRLCKNVPRPGFKKCLGVRSTELSGAELAAFWGGGGCVGVWLALGPPRPGVYWVGARIRFLFSLPLPPRAGREPRLPWSAAAAARGGFREGKATKTIAVERRPSKPLRELLTPAPPRGWNPVYFLMYPGFWHILNEACSFIFCEVALCERYKPSFSQR